MLNMIKNTFMFKLIFKKINLKNRYNNNLTWNNSKGFSTASLKFLGIRKVIFVIIVSIQYIKYNKRRKAKN